MEELLKKIEEANQQMLSVVKGALTAAYATRVKPHPHQKPDPFETRSKHVQVLLKPSLHKDAVALADYLGISFNHLVELALISSVKEYADKENRRWS